MPEATELKPSGDMAPLLWVSEKRINQSTVKLASLWRKWDALAPEDKTRLHDEVIQEKHVGTACHTCKDAGFVYPKVDGQIDYSRAIPCRCGQTAREVEARQRNHDLAGMAENPTDLLDLFKVNAQNQAAYSAALAFVEGAPETRLLMVHGRHGNGKSHLARATAQRCLEQGLRVRYCYCPTLIGQLQQAAKGEDTTAAEVIDKLVAVDVVILDDLWGHNMTPAHWAWYEQIIGRMYNRAQDGETVRLMVTVNCNPATDIPGPLYSRFRDARIGQVVANTDTDRRPQR